MGLNIIEGKERRNFNIPVRELRGGKRDMFEGGHRVLFIVRWPAAYQGQQVSQHLISQIDIFATVAE